MTAQIAEPFRIEHHRLLGSTNDEALRRLAAGDCGRLIVVAEEQTSGRGRQGRAWSSPRGNLYASLALRDPCPMAEAPRLGFVAGVALAETLRRRLGGDDRLRLKWPNDALFAGAKLAGMLLEGSLLRDGAFGCVIGIGVNCVAHPAGLEYATTDLRAAGASDADPSALIRDIAARFDELSRIWNRGGDFDSIRRRWLPLAEGLGRPIAIATPRGRREGVFRDLDTQGRLMIEDASGAETLIEAGDVFFPALAAAHA